MYPYQNNQIQNLKLKYGLSYQELQQAGMRMLLNLKNEEELGATLYKFRPHHDAENYDIEKEVKKFSVDDFLEKEEKDDYNGK
jgi:hypothetical protein